MRMTTLTADRRRRSAVRRLRSNKDFDANRVTPLIRYTFALLFVSMWYNHSIELLTWRMEEVTHTAHE